jgi:hypothetical protein
LSFREFRTPEAQFPRIEFLGTSVNSGTLPSTSVRKHYRFVRLDKTVITICYVNTCYVIYQQY